MKDKIFIRPAPGLKVRNPETGQHIPEAGIDVTPNAYWYRRIQAGDVIVGTPGRPKVQK